MDEGEATQDFHSSDAAVSILPNTLFYDETRGRYVHCITIECDEPFKLQMSEQQGGSKNCVSVISVTRPRPFPFMSLPLELRIKVYSYIIPERSSPFIDTSRFFSKRGLVITRVSRHLRSEVMPIVLGAGRLRFLLIGDLVTFIARLGDSRVHLRDLQIPYLPLHHTQCSSLFGALAGCPQVERLVSTYSRLPISDLEMERFYDAAKQWIYHVTLSRGTKQAALEILDIRQRFHYHQETQTEIAAFREWLQDRIDRDAVLEGWFSVTRNSHGGNGKGGA